VRVTKKEDDEEEMKESRVNYIAYGNFVVGG